MGKLKVKWKTQLNLVWGKPLEEDPKKREAIAYAKGFPATFYMTARRVFVLGAFIEKHGIFKKATNNFVYFEAGLQYLKEAHLNIGKKARAGTISFNPHGDIEDGIIHFIRLEPAMVHSIESVLEDITNLRRKREDTGIVRLGGNPEKYFRHRLES